MNRRLAIRKRRRCRGKRFESIEEQNAHLARWNEHCAATRIHGTTKRQVRAMFEEERPYLVPLPLTRFEYYRICERTVHFDGYIEVDSAYYSAPPRYVGSRVVVHVGRLWLRILDPHDAPMPARAPDRAAQRPAPNARRRPAANRRRSRLSSSPRASPAPAPAARHLRRSCRGPRRDCPARALRHARPAAPLRGRRRRSRVRVCRELGHLKLDASFAPISAPCHAAEAQDRAPHHSGDPNLRDALHSLTQGATP